MARPSCFPRSETVVSMTGWAAEQGHKLCWIKGCLASAFAFWFSILRCSRKSISPCPRARRAQNAAPPQPPPQHPTAASWDRSLSAPPRGQRSTTATYQPALRQDCAILLAATPAPMTIRSYSLAMVAPLGESSRRRLRRSSRKELRL